MMGEPVHVLLVTDNPADASQISQLLNEGTHGECIVKHVRTTQDALHVLVKEGEEMQVILLDLGLGDGCGFSSLQQMALAAGDACLVVITAEEREDLALVAVREGAQDYLFQGQMNGPQLRRVIRCAIERERIRCELRNLSLQDPLTGLHNRQGFLVLAEQQMKVSRRNQSPSLLMFFDLDGLKGINDTFGHEAGNRAILEATALLRSSLRQCDILARLGGDEFAGLILGAPESAEAVIRANLQRRVAEFNSHPERSYRLSFSLGVALCDPREEVSVVDLLEIADSRMYSEKKRKAASSAV